MLAYWQSIPKGTRVLALVSLLGFFAILLLRGAAGFDLTEPLALGSSTLSGLQLWRLITYALVPGDPIGAFFGTLFLLLVTPSVENAWGMRMLFVYFAVCAAATGLALLVVLGNDPMLILTNSGAVLGLIVAWYQVNRHQRFLLFGGPEVSAGVAAAVTASFILVPLAFGCGWKFAPAIAVGAPAGWLFIKGHALLAGRRQRSGTGRHRVSRIEL